jgi:hypothetical protein
VNLISVFVDWQFRAGTVSLFHIALFSGISRAFNVQCYCKEADTKMTSHCEERDLEWESHSFVSCWSLVFRRALCHEMKGPSGGRHYSLEPNRCPLSPELLLARNLNWIPWLNPSDEAVDMRTSLVLSAANMTNKRSNFIFLIPQSLKNFWMLNSEYRIYTSSVLESTRVSRLIL